MRRSADYERGYKDGVKHERQRIEENYTALVRAMNKTHPNTISSIIDFAIRQVVTGSPHGRPPTDRST